MVKQRWLRALPLAVTGTILLAACGSGGGGSPSSTSQSGGDLTGSLFVSGSSTVLPISQRNAEKFASDNPSVDITVEGPGTSDGFALFCDGESDVSDASRAIKSAEVQTCADNGIDFIELYVGIDGLSVIVPHESAIDCLSLTDLWALLGPEAEGFTKWSDANDLAQQTFDATDGKFGAIHTPYPDLPLDVTAPGEESGTFDSFVELVIDKVAAELGVDDATTRPDYQTSADDNVIVQGVSGSPGGLGWVGFAYYEENADVLKAVQVDAGNGCVAPTTDSIASHDYPISRPLFIYLNAGNAADNEALTAFIDFYMSDEGRASVTEVGYVDIPDVDWQATVQGWTSRTTGTHVGG